MGFSAIHNTSLYKRSCTSTVKVLTKMEAPSKTKTPSRFFLYSLTFFAVIGGLLFGYNIGIISGAMLLIQPQFNLSTLWHEIIVSGTVAAAAVASLCTSFPLDKIGRRRTILVSDVVFVVGAVVMGASVNKEMLLVGRIIVGLATGITSVAVPVYVAECSPAELRGRMVTYNQLTITIGILLSSIVCGAINEMASYEMGWRFILSFGGIMAVIQFIAFLCLPESPRWLVDKDRHEDARAVLVHIRVTEDVDIELEGIKQSVKFYREINKGGRKTFLHILRTPYVRKALIVGISLAVFQQFSGINTVIYYSGTILTMAGFPVNAAIWLVVVPNSVNFLATFIGLWAVERYGRRVLIITSIAGVAIACVILATGFHLSSAFSPSVNRSITEVDSNGNVVLTCHNQYTLCESCVTDPDCGFCYNDITQGTCLPAADETRSTSGRCNTSDVTSDMTWLFGFCPNDYYWISIIGMVAFVFAFAPGLGPMPWTINSEIYPLWARSTCNSITTASVWLINLLVAITFLTLTETMTKYGTFWMFTGFCIIGAIVFYVFLPETKDKTLEEVEELFMTEAETFEKRKSASKGSVSMVDLDVSPKQQIDMQRL